MTPIRYADELPATADLVVVGGGIIGAATAFHAARAGLRALVLESRPAICTFTTAAAAGGFRLQLDAPDEVELVAESVDLFAGFAEATGQDDYDPGLREQGYLWVTTSQERAAAQRDLVERQRSWGVDGIELIDGDEARELFPYLSPDVVQARFRQRDGLIDPKAITFGLMAGSRAGVLTRCRVTGFRVAGDRLEAVVTERGEIQTRTAVVACGPLSGLLAETAGIRLSIETVRRHKLVLPEVPEVPPEAPMTIDEDTGAHWRPAFSGAWALFTDPTVPPSPPADPVDADPGFAFQVLDPAGPAALARVSPFWREVWERGSDHWVLQAGQYTMTPDRRPLLGEAGIEGLFVNTGYSGHGIMAGPAGSRHLIDLLTGKIRSDQNAFAPDRAFAAPHEGVL